jgi:hypothetical protein
MYVTEGTSTHYKRHCKRRDSDLDYHNMCQYQLLTNVKSNTTSSLYVLT